MPGGKRRLKGLFTGGIQVGGTGNYVKHVLAGSVSVAVGSVGAVQGSQVCEVATISGLTPSHILLAQEQQATQNACLILSQAKAGAGQASLVWTYIAGCGAGAAADHTATVRFLAAQV